MPPFPHFLQSCVYSHIGLCVSRRQHYGTELFNCVWCISLVLVSVPLNSSFLDEGESDLEGLHYIHPYSHALSIHPSVCYVDMASQTISSFFRSPAAIQSWREAQTVSLQRRVGWRVKAVRELWECKTPPLHPVLMQLDIKKLHGAITRGHSTSLPTQGVLAYCQWHRARASHFECPHRTAVCNITLQPFSSWTFFYLIMICGMESKCSCSLLYYFRNWKIQ